MSPYYGNDPWDESNDYNSRPGPSRPPNPDHRSYDSDEDDLRTARNAQFYRPTGGSRSGGSSYNTNGSGYPGSRSSRPSQPDQTRYDAHDEYDEELHGRLGRGNGGPTYGQQAWSDDEYGGPRMPPSRSQPGQHPDRNFEFEEIGSEDPRARMDHSSQPSRGSQGPQPSRRIQSSQHHEPDWLENIPCPNDVHIGFEHHIDYRPHSVLSSMMECRVSTAIFSKLSHACGHRWNVVTHVREESVVVEIVEAESVVVDIDGLKAVERVRWAVVAPVNCGIRKVFKHES